MKLLVLHNNCILLLLPQFIHVYYNMCKTGKLIKDYQTTQCIRTCFDNVILSR
jgi:hypothetical protein